MKNRHIISGKNAQELYADFDMPPKASDNSTLASLETTEAQSDAARHDYESSVNSSHADASLPYCSLLLCDTRGGAAASAAIAAIRAIVVAVPPSMMLRKIRRRLHAHDAHVLNQALSTLVPELNKRILTLLSEDQHVPRTASTRTDVSLLAR